MNVIRTHQFDMSLEANDIELIDLANFLGKILSPAKSMQTNEPIKIESIKIGEL